MTKLFIDIDETLSPRVVKQHHYKNYGPFIERVVSSYRVLMPEFILEFLKEFSSKKGNRVYLISNWGSKADDFASEFGFKAFNIDYSNYSEKNGMLGRIETVKRLSEKGDVYLDSKLTIAHQRTLALSGVLALPPTEKNACLSRRNIERVKNFID